MSLIDFDAITQQHLRQVGGLKWSRPGEIGVGIAEMDFGIAPVIRQALHETIDLGQLGYPTRGLVRPMQTAFASWAAEHWDWEVDPRRVRPLPDVLSALLFMLRHTTPAGSRVVIPTPAYYSFFPTIRTAGFEITEVPMARDGDSWVYDLDALDAALPGASVMILCNPHNPIGRVLEPREMAPITELVDKHGVRVFADEIHAPLTFPGHAHVPYASTSEAAAAHTFTATSASKAWNLAGLKAAQAVISNDADEAACREFCEFTEAGVSNPGLVAAAAAYTSGEPWLREVLAYLDETRTWFAAQVEEMLPGAWASVPEGSYLSWIDFCGMEQTAQLGDDPASYFQKFARVQLTPGHTMGAIGRGWARFNLATTRPIIAEALERMAGALPS